MVYESSFSLPRRSSIELIYSVWQRFLQFKVALIRLLLNEMTWQQQVYNVPAISRNFDQLVPTTEKKMWCVHENWGAKEKWIPMQKLY